MAAYKVLGVNDERDTCECCGKTGLKRVVWIENTETNDIKCFGTTCAQSPAKGFGCDAAIQRAVREHIADGQFALKLAYRNYQQLGGKMITDRKTYSQSYADRPLYDQCLANATSFIASERNRMSKLAKR